MSTGPKTPEGKARVVAAMVATGGSAYTPSLTNGSPFLGAMSAAGSVAYRHRIALPAIGKPRCITALVREESCDPLAGLRDVQNAIEMTVRTTQWRHIDWRASFANSGRRAFDPRLRKYQVRWRVEDKNRCLDLLGIGAGELVGLDEVEEIVRVRRAGRACPRS